MAHRPPIIEGIYDYKSALAAEPDQEHPEVVRLRAGVDAAAAGLALVRSGRAVEALPLLARAYRAERLCVDVTADDAQKVLVACLSILPSSDDVPPGGAMLPSPLGRPLPVWPLLSPPVDLDALLVFWQLTLGLPGLGPESVMQQLLHAPPSFFARSPAQLHELMACVFTAIAPGTGFRTAAGLVRVNGTAGAVSSLTSAIEAHNAGDCDAAATGLGSLLWMRGSARHMVAKTLPERLAARDDLLRAARVSAPGTDHLGNVYARLASLVIEIASGCATGVDPGDACSGCELELARGFVDEARAAADACLRVYRVKRRPQADDLLERIAAFFLRGARCELHSCRKSGARMACRGCRATYCSVACQTAHWGCDSAPHKRECKRLAAARAQMEELARCGSTREQLDDDVAARVGVRWQLTSVQELD